MSVASESQQATSPPRGIVREVTPLSLWGGDTLVYRSVILLSIAALPLIGLALTIAALLLMYWAGEPGAIGVLSAFAEHSSNLNYLIGIVATSIGTLAAGLVYHRRVATEAARVVAGAQQLRLAMEQAQETQAQLQTAHAKLQQMNDALAERGRFRDLEMARAKRDIDLFHDVVSKDIPASLRVLREAIARPDEQTEARLQRELNRIESVVDALEELGRHGLPALQCAPVDLSALARDEIQLLRGGRDSAHMRFDVDAGLHAEGDRRLLTALLRHLVKRAARACRAQPDPLVHFGSGCYVGRAVFFVRDNGPGMKSSQRDKLFRPFERGNARNGAGDDTVDIGIVSARRIVERHGGEFIIESLPSRGTTVFFSLPGA